MPPGKESGSPWPAFRYYHKIISFKSISFAKNPDQKILTDTEKNKLKNRLPNFRAARLPKLSQYD